MNKILQYLFDNKDKSIETYEHITYNDNKIFDLTGWVGIEKLKLIEDTKCIKKLLKEDFVIEGIGFEILWEGRDKWGFWTERSHKEKAYKITEKGKESI